MITLQTADMTIGFLAICFFVAMGIIIGAALRDYWHYVRKQREARQHNKIAGIVAISEELTNDVDDDAQQKADAFALSARAHLSSHRALRDFGEALDALGRCSAEDIMQKVRDERGEAFIEDPIKQMFPIVLVGECLMCIACKMQLPRNATSPGIDGDTIESHLWQAHGKPLLEQYQAYRKQFVDVTGALSSDLMM